MKNVNPEFKQNFDTELRNGEYATKTLTKKIIIGILTLIIIAGGCKIGYTLTFGKWQKNAEREVFKNTTAYTEQAASFLADAYKQYNEAENDADKNSIMEYVIMKYPNLDTGSIDNSKLKTYYNQCLEN